MPSRRTTKAALASVTAMPSIPKYINDQFVTGPMSAAPVENISLAFKKALIEQALGVELSHHLGYGQAPTSPRPAATGNADKLSLSLRL